MTRWLSRRHPRYIRSLVYMLQASEYDIGDFLRWHERVSDFRAVEKRKRLIFTSKALALYVAGWMSTALVLSAATYTLFNFTFPWNLFFAAVLALEMPLFAVGGILLALLFGRFVQIPVEMTIVNGVKRKLEVHPGVKIAVAGSYGKTSMRDILMAVLSEGKNMAAPIGSYNTPLGIAQFAKTLKGDEEGMVFEFGEYYSGDIRSLAEVVQPSIGVITGVNEAHLEKFVSLENTAATVFELADYLGNQPVYVNAENEIARTRAGHMHILYSREGCNGWEVSNAKTGLDGTSFTMKRGDATLNVQSKLLGLHHIGPLVAAVDIATRLGLSHEQIERGLSKTKPFEHRLEPKMGDDGVLMLDDSYNGNPDGVKAVIEYVGSLKANRRWYVSPGLVEMGNRKEEVHKTIGSQLAQAGIEKVVLIRNSVTPYIEQGLKDAGYKGDIVWFDDGLSAYAALPRMTVKGDIVLLQNDWPDQYF